MHIVRAGLPAIVGVLDLLFGLQSVSAGLQSGTSEIQVGVLPIGVGIVLLLAAFATARRTRLGYLLGLGVGALMAVAGPAIIATEIPFMQRGGLGAAIGGGVIVMAVIWTVVWLAYTWAFARSKTAFAPALVPGDRRLAAAVVLVVVIAVGSFVGLGAIQANTTQQSIDSDGAARIVVEATTFEVHVLDRALTPSPAAGGQAVDRLKLELVLRSDERYALTAPPSLCLTSLAMYQHPAYKQGLLCWGMPGPEDALRSSSVATSIPSDTTTVTIELLGPGSPCPFPPGMWNAELTLAPGLYLAGGGVGPAPGLYSIDATFLIDTGDVAPPPSGTPAAELSCLGVSP